MRAGACGWGRCGQGPRWTDPVLSPPAARMTMCGREREKRPSDDGRFSPFSPQTIGSAVDGRDGRKLRSGPGRSDAAQASSGKIFPIGVRFSAWN
jgi:hypothetical protein